MSWSIKKLGEFVEVIMGQAPLSEECNKEGNGTIFVKAGEFGKKYPIIREWTTRPLKLAKQNDTLLCVVGATCGKVNKASFDCAIGRSVAAIRPKSKAIDENFLFLFLETKVTFLRNKSQGAAQGVITREMINSLEISLPPLAEQQRIAAILDTAELIKHKRGLAIEKLDKLILSIFNEMFGKVDNFAPLGSLVDKKIKLIETKLDKVWSLSLEQIESNTGRLLQKIIVPKDKLGTSTYFFKPPVILYSKLRPYLNKVFIPKEAGYATTELVPLYLKENIVKHCFLTTYLRSKHFVEFANTNSGGAKMPRVMMDKLWQHAIPVPPIEMQIKFENIVNAINDERMKQESSYSLFAELVTSIQSQAFSGQL